MDRVRTDAPDDHAGVIQIRLWLDGSMPAGIATGPGGAARDFTGWVGLMSAVDALVADGGSRRVEEDER
jgi:hypothetical protein